MIVGNPQIFSADQDRLMQAGIVVVVDALIAEGLLNQSIMLEILLTGGAPQPRALIPVQTFMLQVVFVPDVVG